MKKNKYVKHFNPCTSKDTQMYWKSHGDFTILCVSNVKNLIVLFGPFFFIPYTLERKYASSCMWGVI